LSDLSEDLEKRRGGVDRVREPKILPEIWPGGLLSVDIPEILEKGKIF
jgi:hypothetical protein